MASTTRGHGPTQGPARLESMEAALDMQELLSAALMVKKHLARRTRARAKARGHGACMAPNVEDMRGEIDA